MAESNPKLVMNGKEEKEDIEGMEEEAEEQTEDFFDDDVDFEDFRNLSLSPDDELPFSTNEDPSAQKNHFRPSDDNLTYSSSEESSRYSSEKQEEYESPFDDFDDEEEEVEQRKEEPPYRFGIEGPKSVESLYLMIEPGREDEFNDQMDLLSQQVLSVQHEICSEHKEKQLKRVRRFKLEKKLILNAVSEAGILYFPGNFLQPITGKRIDDKDLPTIMEALNDLPETELKGFNFAYNNITDDGIALLAPYIQERPSIVHLNLAHNDFTAKGLYNLTTHLIRRPSLQSLKITGVKVGDEGINSITCLYMCGKGPRDLDISETDLTTPGFQALCTSFQAVDDDDDFPKFLQKYKLPFSLDTLARLKTENHELLKSETYNRLCHSQFELIPLKEKERRVTEELVEEFEDDEENDDDEDDDDKYEDDEVVNEKEKEDGNPSNSEKVEENRNSANNEEVKEERKSTTNEKAKENRNSAQSKKGKENKDLGNNEKVKEDRKSATNEKAKENRNSAQSEKVKENRNSANNEKVNEDRKSAANEKVKGERKSATNEKANENRNSVQSEKLKENKDSTDNEKAKEERKSATNEKVKENRNSAQSEKGKENKDSANSEKVKEDRKSATNEKVKEERKSAINEKVKEERKSAINEKVKEERKSAINEKAKENRNSVQSEKLKENKDSANGEKVKEDRKSASSEKGKENRTSAQSEKGKENNDSANSEKVKEDRKSASSEKGKENRNSAQSEKVKEERKSATNEKVKEDRKSASSEKGKENRNSAQSEKVKEDKTEKEQEGKKEEETTNEKEKKGENDNKKANEKEKAEGSENSRPSKAESDMQTKLSAALENVFGSSFLGGGDGSPQDPEIDLSMEAEISIEITQWTKELLPIDEFVEVHTYFRDRVGCDPVQPDGRPVIVCPSLYSLEIDEEFDEESTAVIPGKGTKHLKKTHPLYMDTLVEHTEAQESLDIRELAQREAVDTFTAEKSAKRFVGEMIKDAGTIAGVSEYTSDGDRAQLLLMTILDTAKTFLQAETQGMSGDGELTLPELKLIWDHSLETIARIFRPNIPAHCKITDDTMGVFVEEFMKISSETFYQLIQVPFFADMFESAATKGCIELTTKKDREPVAFSTEDDDMTYYDLVNTVVIKFLEEVIFRAGDIVGCGDPHNVRAEAFGIINDRDDFGDGNGSGRRVSSGRWPSIIDMSEDMVSPLVNQLFEAGGMLAADALTCQGENETNQDEGIEPAKQYLEGIFKQLTNFLTQMKDDDQKLAERMEKTPRKFTFSTKPVRLVLNRPFFRGQEENMASKLAAYLRTNDSVQCLHARKWGLGEEGAINLMSGILSNHNLVTLDLSGNGIGCEGMKPLAEYIRRNQNLRHLVFNHNRLRNPGMKVLAEAIPESSLFSLNVAHNDTGEAGLNPLLQAIGNSNIYSLYILGNCFAQSSCLLMKGLFDAKILNQPDCDVIVLDEEDQLVIIVNSQARNLNEWYEVPARIDTDYVCPPYYNEHYTPPKVTIFGAVDVEV